MGWELHITRREHIADEGNDITRAEWIAAAEADPELTLDEAGMAEFAASEDEVWWFKWLDGAIDVIHADGPAVAKMVALAEVLGAEVQDANGYVYNADGTSQLKEIWREPEPARPGKPGLFARLFGRS